MQNNRNWTSLCESAESLLLDDLENVDEKQKNHLLDKITAFVNEGKTIQSLTADEGAYQALTQDIPALSNAQNQQLVLKLVAVETMHKHAVELDTFNKISRALASNAEDVDLTDEQQKLFKRFSSLRGLDLDTRNARILSARTKKENNEPLNNEEKEAYAYGVHEQRAQQIESYLNAPKNQEFLNQPINKELEEIESLLKDGEEISKGEKEQEQAKKYQQEGVDFWSTHPHTSAQEDGIEDTSKTPQGSLDQKSAGIPPVPPLAQEASQAGLDGAEAQDLNAPNPAKEQDLAKEIFGAGSNKQFEDPEKIDWAKFREEVIWKQLDKIDQEKNLADLGLNLFMIVAFEIPAALILNLTQQMREVNKKNEEKAKTNYNNAIDSNLKQRGYSRNDFISELALKAKQWICDDSALQGVDLKHPGKLTPYQKAHLKKYLFAQSLPRTADGKDLDFKKFSRKQRKQYNQYVAIAMRSEPMHSYINSQTGVRLKNEDLAQFAMTAADMNLAGGLERDGAYLRPKGAKTLAPKDVLKEPRATTQEKMISDLVAERPLTSASLDELEKMLSSTEVGAQDAQKIKDIFGAEKSGKKVSSELRASVAEVLVKEGLYDPQVIDAISHMPSAQTGGTKLQDDVRKWAKDRKNLRDKAQGLDEAQQALQMARNKEQASQRAVSNIRNANRARG